MEKMMKLNFIVDGEIYQSVSVEKGEQVIAIDPPAKEGYRFVRWDGLPDTGAGGKEVSAVAVYEAELYEVTVILDDNTLSSEKLPFGAPITLPQGEYEWTDACDTVPAHDLVIRGSSEPATYTLTMLVDGELFGSYRFPAGADLTGLPTPEKIGHDFSGWNKKYKVMPHSNLTVKGRYKPHRHTLSFVIEDEMEFTKKVDFGTPIRALGNPLRENFSFSGWGDIPATMPDHDLIFKGRFSLNARQLRFVLDGQLIYESTLDVGAPIKAPETPVREGYMFSGWRGLPKTMPDRDFTAEGKYYLRKYKLVYMVDGEVYEKQQIPFGAPVEKLRAPEKEGFRFSGWSDIPASMPAEDVVVTGFFTES